MLEICQHLKFRIQQIHDLWRRIAHIYNRQQGRPMISGGRRRKEFFFWPQMKCKKKKKRKKQRKIKITKLIKNLYDYLKRQITEI